MTNQVNIVNDSVFKADSTFIYDNVDPLELCDEEKSLNIVIGPYYRMMGSSLDTLVQNLGVTAILNLQSSFEICSKNQ